MVHLFTYGEIHGSLGSCYGRMLTSEKTALVPGFEAPRVTICIGHHLIRDNFRLLHKTRPFEPRRAKKGGVIIADLPPHAVIIIQRAR